MTVRWSRGRGEHGLHWGRARENGIWVASVSRRRVMWRGHDSHAAAGTAEPSPDALDWIRARIRRDPLR